MSRRRIEYDPPKVIERIDNENSMIWTHRFANQSRADAVALREAAQEHERKAAELREQIGEYFQPGEATIGAGGEVADASNKKVEAEKVDISDIDAVQRTASLFRLEAVARADAFAPAIDLAENMGAENSLEKMLCHQMAVAHCLALRLAAKSTTSAYQVADWVPVPKQQAEASNAARLAGASARLMGAFSRGAEALHKLRGGNPQQIIVQYVQVGEGGQAVINGNANTRGRGKGK